MLRHLARLTILLAGLFASFALWNLTTPYPDTPPLDPGNAQVDRILIEKSARRLTAFRDGEPVLSYAVALGGKPEGDKRQQGDGRTPEGLFHIDRRNTQSAYHLSLGIDYPRPQDRARAAAAGVNPGGDIFIHGQPNALGNLLTVPGDWTQGCIAVSNAQMETLWRIVPTGTEVDIRP